MPDSSPPLTIVTVPLTPSLLLTCTTTTTTAAPRRAPASLVPCALIPILLSRRYFAFPTLARAITRPNAAYTLTQILSRHLCPPTITSSVHTYTHIHTCEGGIVQSTATRLATNQWNPRATRSRATSLPSSHATLHLAPSCAHPPHTLCSYTTRQLQPPRTFVLETRSWFWSLIPSFIFPACSQNPRRLCFRIPIPTCLLRPRYAPPRLETCRVPLRQTPHHLPPHGEAISLLLPSPSTLKMQFMHGGPNQVHLYRPRIRYPSLLRLRQASHNKVPPESHQISFSSMLYPKNKQRLFLPSSEDDPPTLAMRHPRRTGNLAKRLKGSRKVS